MTTTLRAAAVVAALLASGFTAERLARDPAAAPPPEATPAAGLPPSPAEASPVLPRRLPMGPVQGPVSSPFGPRVHPVTGHLRHHDGVDLAVPAGTAVWTVAPGVVRSVGRQPGYGLVVEIEHATGLGEPVRTRYAHLASVDAAIHPGRRVARGVALGASGGRPGQDGVSTGAHLHFEVRDASGRAIDPARVVRLPAAASTGPRWAGRAAPLPDAPPPLPPSPDAPAPAPGAAPADTLEDDLPPLVLPDYPSLPTPTGTP